MNSLYLQQLFFQEMVQHLKIYRSCVCGNLARCAGHPRHHVFLYNNDFPSRICKARYWKTLHHNLWRLHWQKHNNDKKILFCFTVEQYYWSQWNRRFASKGRTWRLWRLSILTCGIFWTVGSLHLIWYTCITFLCSILLVFVWKVAGLCFRPCLPHGCFACNSISISGFWTPAVSALTTIIY